MIKKFALMKSGDPAHPLELCKLGPELRRQPTSDWRINQIDNDLWIGLGPCNTPTPFTVATVKDLLASIETIFGDVTWTLRWAFSSVEIASTELSGLLRRWEETGEPPVLSIMTVELGKEQHVTDGLAQFAGHELAVRFGNPDLTRKAARSLIRLARYALMTGGISRNVVYEEINGCALHLEWPNDGSDLNMVTIVL